MSVRVGGPEGVDSPERINGVHSLVTLEAGLPLPEHIVVCHSSFATSEPGGEVLP